MSEQRNTMKNEPSEYMRIPISKNCCTSCRDFFYNPSEGTVFGKTGKQWGVTGLFYLVFFSVLAAFFAICMEGLLATISDVKPTWTLGESLIGTSPGMGFRPLPDNADKKALIWYQASNTTQIQHWIQRLDDFLKDYHVDPSKLQNDERNQQICNYTQQNNLKPGNVCAADIKDWGPCSRDNGYGYKHSSPCVVIKLNKIFGWVPDVYKNTDELPDDMPEDLVYHIGNLTNPALMETVWVSCKGRHSSDAEALGTIEYFPSPRGFPAYYYPYKNYPNYLSPLVVVHFLRPRLNTIIDVECRAWAKNIKYDKYDRLGMVQFELLIDD